MSPTSPRRLLGAAICTAVSIVASALVPSAAWAARTIVVDDDGSCSPGALTSIAAALDVAQDGDTISVCPGVYQEAATVTRSVRIIGPASAVSRLECFGEWPTDLDTSTFAVLRPPTAPGEDAIAPVLTIDADDVEVTGLVFEDVQDDDPGTDESGGYSVFVAALATTDSHSGYLIRGNAFRDSALAVEFGSSGEKTSRLERNCFRDDLFAVANQRFTLTGGDIVGNSTLRSGLLAYEIGTGLRGATSTTLRGNTSRADTAGIRLERTTDTTVTGNRVEAWSTSGIEVAGDNTDLAIVGNVIAGGGTDPAPAVPIGLLFSTPADAGSPSSGVQVRGNTVSGISVASAGRQTGLGIVALAGALVGAEIVGNRFSDNAQTGLVLREGSVDNTVTGNTASRNGLYGIRIFGSDSTGNLLTGNVLRGNGVADARDESDPDPSDGTALLNTWRGTSCRVDIPAGAICRR